MFRPLVSLNLALALLSGAECIELLIAADNCIYKSDTESNKSSLLANVGKSIYEMDVHYKYSLVYFVMWDHIKRLNMSSGNEVSNVIQTEDYMYGIAVDWVFNNIYWTHTYKVKVDMADLDGKDQKTIISRKDIHNLDSLEEVPYLFDIHVDPYARKLFVLAGKEGGAVRGSVVRSDLDGQNLMPIKGVQFIPTKTIALDIPKTRLYGTGRKDDNLVFYSCDYNGGDVEIYSVNTPNWAFPMRVLGKSLYMVYKKSNSLQQDKLYKMEWDSLKNSDIQMQSLYSSHYTDIHDISVFEQSYQMSDGELELVECDRKQCAYSCIIHSNSEVRCLCPSGQVINADGRTCQDSQLDLNFTSTSHLVKTASTIKPPGILISFDPHTTQSVSIHKNQTKFNTIVQPFVHTETTETNSMSTTEKHEILPPQNISYSKAHSNVTFTSGPVIKEQTEQQDYSKGGTRERTYSVWNIVCLTVLPVLIPSIMYWICKPYIKRVTQRIHRDNSLRYQTGMETLIEA